MQVADVYPEGEDLDRRLIEVTDLARQEILESLEDLSNLGDTTVDLPRDLERVSRNCSVGCP